MADLDDFFAKKDRKKPKGKKFLTTEEVAKKLEETGKRVVEKIKPKEKLTIPEEEGKEPQPVEEEEEWREFQEEKKDYTGLKIGNLTVSENVDGDSDDERGTGEDGSDGEPGEGNVKTSGPWKKSDQGTQPEGGESVVTAAPAPVASVQSSGAGIYKTPHARNRPAQSMNPRSRMKNVAPDIRNEQFFPGLNSKQPNLADTSNVWGARRKKDEGTFEEVRNRGANKAYSLSESQPQAAKLSLDNKYGALSQDQS